MGRIISRRGAKAAKKEEGRSYHAKEDFEKLY